MQRKTELLKWVAPLLIALIVGGVAFTGTLMPTKADSSSNSSTTCDAGASSSSSSSSSSAPNGCHFNTKPSDGDCELAWKDQGGGNTDLDASEVTDQGLRDTIEGKIQPPGYHLWCAGSQTSCKLVSSDSNAGQDGNPTLSLDNITVSPYVRDGLLNKYRLECDNNDSGSSSSTSNEKRTNGFKIGSVIGTADVSLQCPTRNQPPCTSITLSINVNGLLNNHSYDVYIADNACPLHNTSLGSLFIQEIQSDGSGLLHQNNIQLTGSFKPLPSGENVCVYDNSKNHDPQSDTPVARGHFINHRGSQGTSEHANIHQITQN